MIVKKIFGALAVGVMAISMASFANSNARNEISVGSQIEVAPNEAIMLSDIAILNNSELGNIEIFPKMNDGEIKNLSNLEISKQIKNAIAENENFDGFKYTLFVPSNVAIKAKSKAIPTTRIQNTISMELQSRCGDCRIVFKDIKMPTIHEKITNSSCQLQTENLKASASFLIPYVCTTEQESKTYWISGSVKLIKMAPVTQRQLAPGDRIMPKDLKMEEVDITFSKDGIPTLMEAEGQLAARYLPIHQPVYKSDLKRELAITRGQLIKAVSGNDTFEVSSQALSEEQGYIGDMIKIKNSETQKILSGQIIEKGVVRVQ